jgi:hypothetical protein
VRRGSQFLSSPAFSGTDGRSSVPPPEKSQLQFVDPYNRDSAPAMPQLTAQVNSVVGSKVHTEPTNFPVSQIVSNVPETLLGGQKVLSDLSPMLTHEMTHEMFGSNSVDCLAAEKLERSEHLRGHREEIDREIVNADQQCEMDFVRENGCTRSAVPEDHTRLTKDIGVSRPVFSVSQGPVVRTYDRNVVHPTTVHLIHEREVHATRVENVQR